MAGRSEVLPAVPAFPLPSPACSEQPGEEEWELASELLVSNQSVKRNQEGRMSLPKETAVGTDAGLETTASGWSLALPFPNAQTQSKLLDLSQIRRRG